ncbi:MAG: hypothetical protein NTW29_23045 [Bacteroidetes bacterium]|nr:hypothetical protein [Bacteroidota bacterium]
MKSFLILLFSYFISSSSYAQTDSVSQKAQSQIRQYWFVMLSKGKTRDQDSATAAKIQTGHLANITRLYQQGKLKVAGPFGGDGGAAGL